MLERRSGLRASRVCYQHTTAATNNRKQRIANVLGVDEAAIRDQRIGAEYEKKPWSGRSLVSLPSSIVATSPQSASQMRQNVGVSCVVMLSAVGSAVRVLPRALGAPWGTEAMPDQVSPILARLRPR